MENEKKKKILVVEDEQDMKNMIKLRMESAGYEIVLASNGEEGLEKVKAECPDLIITDVLMPIMDGFAFYKELKKSQALSGIPVIILTARGQMEDSFKVVGADDFIAKPFLPQDLLAKVDALCKKVKMPASDKVAKKILIAGSSRDAVDNMIVQLKRQGCDVEAAFIGPDIITKAVQFNPDVMILDVQMYEMPTSEVIGVLRHMPQIDKKPILIYSYFDPAELGRVDVREQVLSIDATYEDCMESGATEYIERFNDGTFLKKVDKYIKD